MAPGGRLRVGVVGCGTAGAAAAILLARAGHAVTLFERVTDPGPVGAGIVLQPTGLAVLADLGLADAILTRGARIEHLRCETPRGRPVLDLHYADLAPGLFGVGLHRGVLFDVLAGAAARCCDVRTGVAIRRIGGEAGAHELVDAEGRPHGPYDLVVVADGARSELRDRCGIGQRVGTYPWGALWTVVEDPDERFAGRLFQVVRDTTFLFGLLPTGRGPGPTPGPPLVSLFYSLPAVDVPRWRAAGLAAWKDEILALVPAAAPVLSRITSTDELLFASYHDVVLSRWHEEGVVFLGDAAHATSPQLGQGCNLALIDAAELAVALARAPSLPRALADYTRRRRGHLGFYQLATRWLTPFFQSDLRLLGPLRDLGLPLVGRLPFGRRQMLFAMAGISRGPLRPPLPLPAPKGLIESRREST